MAGLDPQIRIACEPGTYITSASGLLIVEVTTVEPRKSGTWLGVDAGHAVNVFAAHYGIPMAFIPVAEPERPITTTVHIGGNINEANDVFARNRPFPVVTEEELLALFPAGGYGSSMASDHCLRGAPAEVLVG
jgi:diaminopimelate decarboxylase